VIGTDLFMIDSTEHRTVHHTATSALLENLPKIGSVRARQDWILLVAAA
jgi:hypothetical protein